MPHPCSSVCASLTFPYPSLFHSALTLLLLWSVGKTLAAVTIAEAILGRSRNANGRLGTASPTGMLWFRWVHCRCPPRLPVKYLCPVLFARPLSMLTTRPFPVLLRFAPLSLLMCQGSFPHCQAALIHWGFKRGCAVRGQEVECVDSFHPPLLYHSPVVRTLATRAVPSGATMP